MERIVKEYKVIGRPTTIEAKRIMGGRNAYEELKQIFDPDTINLFETFYVVYLNRNNVVKGFQKVGEGTATSTPVDTKRMMMGALDSLATGLIISHNHPSGNIKPSEEDRKVTKRINQACKLLDLTLIDHIIMGANGYYSFAENGELN